jgi:hypothetical protein
VIVEESPGFSDVGFAEQLIVGGSNGLIVNVPEQSADCPGFAPSVTWPATVYVPGAAVVVAMFAVLDVPVITPPVEVQLYVAVFFGFRFSAVPVTVNGSPG